MLLIDIGELHGLTHSKRTSIRLFQSHDQAEERGLTRTVRTNHAHDAIRWQHEIQVGEERLLRIRLRNMLRLNDLVTKTRTIGDIDFEFLFLLLLFLVEHHLVGVQTSLSFGMARLRGHTHPLQLTLQRLAALRGRLLFQSQSLRLLLQPRRVITFPGDTLTTIQFEDPLCHIVEEITVVGDGNHRSLVLLQMLFEPVDTLGIKMVGRLVEQQHVGFLQQQTAESHTTALATRERLHTPIARRTVQGCHRTVEFRIHIPGICRVDDILQLCLTTHQLLHLVGILIVFGQSELHVDLVVFGKGVIHMLHALHHVLLHRLLLVERGILRQIADRIAWCPDDITLILLVETGDDLHQRRFTGTVQTDDTDLSSIEEAEVDVLEHLFLVLLDGLAHSDHRENHFLVVNCCHSLFCLFTPGADGTDTYCRTLLSHC